MAGVVPSTVSLVLNGKAKKMRISEQMAEKIKTIADEAGYKPNHIAVSLRTGSSKIFGLIVEDISNTFFATLAKVIEDEVQMHDYRVVYCSTENDAGKGNGLVNMLSQRQVDGFIITPVAGMEKQVQELVQRKKPIVLIDRFFPGIDVSHVVVDNYSGVETAIKFLINKGYKNIGFVTLDSELVQIHEREQAYLDVMKQHQLPVKENSILRLSYELPKVEIIKIINNYIQNRGDMSAIFFATNYLAIDGLECITALNIKIPNELAIVSFDDHDIFKLFPPGISAVQQPVDELGKTAVKLLMQQIESNENAENKQVKLPVQFIARGSA